MSMESLGSNGKVGVPEALAELQVIRQRIAATGAVDTEHDDLARLMADLEAQKIAPEDAILKARALEDARQNYH